MSMCQSHKVLPEILKCDAQICAMELAFFHTETLPATKDPIPPIPPPPGFRTQGADFVLSMGARPHNAHVGAFWGREGPKMREMSPKSDTFHPKRLK